MPIPESTLSSWSHHQAGTAFKQAHVPIREALDTYSWPSDVKYQVFLQGSYKNDTNLGGDSDVDVVVRLASKLKPRAAGRCFSQGRIPAMEVIPGPCVEGDEGQVRECREERPQDVEGAEGQAPGGR